MRAPHTWFSSEFKGGAGAVKARLKSLMAPARTRKGALALAALLAVVVLIGCAVRILPAPPPATAEASVPAVVPAVPSPTPSAPAASAPAIVIDSGQYDAETGLYYNADGNFTLNVPPELRNLILFQQTGESDGSFSVAAYVRPVYESWLQNGGEEDGALGSVRVFTREQYERFYAEANRAFPPNDFYYSSNVIPGREPIYLQGLHYRGTGPTDHRTALKDPELAALLARARQARFPGSDRVLAGGYTEGYSLFATLSAGKTFPVLSAFSLLDQEGRERFGIGTRGDLPLGQPEGVEISERYAAPGDRWERVDYGGVTAIYYDAADGAKTVISLDCTAPGYRLFSRGTGVGDDAGLAASYYRGGDYSYAMDEPEGQESGDSPQRFSITDTDAGIPLPCPYRIEIYHAGQSITRVVLYADLTDGRDPFD